ncbi:MAG: helicase-related protein [Gammaproteobacteria bacterium]
MDYSSFLERKSQLGSDGGFKPVWMPDFLFDFQAHLTEWAIRLGRAAMFADCGMGKTPMQLVWAENIARHTGGNVLVMAPLAVSAQTVREGQKFGIECTRSQDGKAHRITVTNYQRLDKFDPLDFVGVVPDESSILKNFSGKIRRQITRFMCKHQYRLLATATAAPNDYTELGTSSEALGQLGHMDMLSRFFVNRRNDGSAKKDMWRFGRHGSYHGQWRFRGHAEVPFWDFVRSWSKSVRRPSDLGFEDGDFILPPLTQKEHVVKTRTLREGYLFPIPAVGLREQREERRRTITERCEKVAELADTGKQVLIWCNLNDEGDLLEKLIPDAVQVAGRHSDDQKEERLLAFAEGKLRALVTKQSIGGWGMNFQRCAHVIEFPSNSFEKHYQGLRRCWRYGQENPVHLDMVSTEGDRGVLDNLNAKAEAADRMFDNLISSMRESVVGPSLDGYNNQTEVPAWLC